MSKLIHRIEQLLINESDPQRRAELEAKRASYLARVGRFRDAEDAIATIRKVFGDGRSGRVTVLVMIAEALVMYYQKLAPGAADRVARAQLLGQAMKDSELIALASAWRGFFEFEASKFESAFRSILLATEYASEEDHSTWTRCAIVISLGFALCGQSAESNSWFLEGRDHALKDGDQASIDALQYNKAAFGVAWLCAQRCKGLVDPAATKHARMELNSARNLQGLVQVDAHSSYVDLSDARLCILEGRHETALRTLDVVAAAGPFPTGHFNGSLLALEIAYCRASLHLVEPALEAFAKFEPSSITALDVDDRLLAAWIVNELSAVDLRFGQPSDSAKALAEAIEEQDAAVASLASQVARFSRT